MAKLNFKHFSKYTGISRQKKETGDVREEFADLVYCRVGGIKAHTLAFRIYESQGEEEYSEGEVDIIRRVAENFCLPGVIDGLYEQLDINKDIKEE